jgi:hypothetical protein
MLNVVNNAAFQIRPLLLLSFILSVIVKPIMLGVAMLSVAMLSVTMLSVIMLNVEMLSIINLISQIRQLLRCRLCLVSLLH